MQNLFQIVSQGILVVSNGQDEYEIGKKNRKQKISQKEGNKKTNHFNCVENKQNKVQEQYLNLNAQKQKKSYLDQTPSMIVHQCKQTDLTQIQDNQNIYQINNTSQNNDIYKNSNEHYEDKNFNISSQQIINQSQNICQSQQNQDQENQVKSQNVDYCTQEQKNKEQKQDQKNEQYEKQFEFLFSNEKFINDFNLDFQFFDQKEENLQEQYEKNNLQKNDQNQQEQQYQNQQIGDKKQENLFLNNKENKKQIYEILENSFYINENQSKKISVRSFIQQQLDEWQSKQELWGEKQAIILAFSDIEKNVEQQMAIYNDSQWQAVGDKLWEIIRQKYDGSLENFENDCRQINQEFNEIKQKQIDNLVSVQNHFKLLKQNINQQLDQIGKNINIKIEECKNLYTPTDVMKFANKKAADFQDLIKQLAGEPKESIQFYKNAFQTQLNSLRKDTRNLLVATQFSNKIKQQNLQQQNPNVYLQQTDLDQISAQEAYDNQRSRIEINNNDNQQDQQQQMDFDENNINLLNFQQINYSAELGIQINQKIREFQDYMNRLLQVCQSQSQPLNQAFQNNLEISQHVQQLIHQQQFNHQQQNNLQQEIQSINNQKKLIKQYTDSVKFFEDFPAINSRQQYKKLSKIQLNAITDLRVQLGYYGDLKNRIESYGYNSLGKQGVKEINEIIFNNLELKNLQNLSLNYHKSFLSIQEYLQMIDQLGNWQLTPQIRKLSLGQEQLKEFNFYLFNLEKLKINLSFCNINNQELSNLSEQIVLLGVCMPKLSFLEIQLQGNNEITNGGINIFQTLANSSLLKNLKEISLNFNDIENISDDSLIQLSEILVRKGKNLDGLYLYIQRTSVSSLGVKRISEILCKKQLQKLLIDFSFNKQLNGQEIIDVAKAITKTKIINLTGQLNQTFFHQNLTELNIRFTYNPSEQQMLEFFDILTNNQYFPSLSSLQIDAYNNKLNDDNFQTIWNNLTKPQSLTKLKYLNLCLAGSKISPESQVLASLKIAQTSKFQNLEELLLNYENARLNKYVSNQICAVNIVQNIVNSENLQKLKHLSLDFCSNDLKEEGCQQVVKELSKPNNKLSLEEISLRFYDNGIEKNQYQELNSQFRNSLITEQLRVANILFGMV
ncbi:hypothetical protein PPERSA_09221 [Pseudocohnilembus persalinus]|uniref:Kinase domain protein n=1 Tax=Pseudocohnilembus persalinus TaxID=266149 RepID=A0A0V0R4D0_PSEPJ|nr:hypothetical protein PPERSA_09221 [Pseudocohnilembus persalinus]|eukprot:KRX09337.1 hypothetical protein PPERSA_09221 [Pseudocohnilembus persalinus]